MSEHTPGTWTLGPETGSPDGYIGVYRLVQNEHGELVCHVWPHSSKYAEADGKLLAASKELLGACRLAEKCLIDLAPYPPEVAVAVIAIVECAHAAIAKAKGEA
jgi:hypothetical protein